jgi:hypothetical protein
LRPWQQRISHFVLSQVAIELTEVILLRVIDQLQNLIRNGEASDWLLRTGQVIGNTSTSTTSTRLEVISQRTLTVLINQVLPKIKPELDGVLNQSVQRGDGVGTGLSAAFNRSPALAAGAGPD